LAQGLKKDVGGRFRYAVGLQSWVNYIYLNTYKKLFLFFLTSSEFPEFSQFSEFSEFLCIYIYMYISEFSEFSAFSEFSEFSDVVLHFL